MRKMARQTMQATAEQAKTLRDLVRVNAAVTSAAEQVSRATGAGRDGRTAREGDGGRPRDDPADHHRDGRAEPDDRQLAGAVARRWPRRRSGRCAALPSSRAAPPRWRGRWTTRASRRPRPPGRLAEQAKATKQIETGRATWRGSPAQVTRAMTEQGAPRLAREERRRGATDRQADRPRARRAGRGGEDARRRDRAAGNGDRERRAGVRRAERGDRADRARALGQMRGQTREVASALAANEGGGGDGGRGGGVTERVARARKERAKPIRDWPEREPATTEPEPT